MTPTETTTILRQHNEWRRGGDIDQPGPLAVGEAIDAAVEMIERLEAAEKAVTEAYRRGYETGQEEIEKERDALRTAVRHESDCVEAAKTEIKALRAKIERMEKIESAAQNLVKMKGRHNTEIAYRRLVATLEESK